ncbi:MAG: ProQ/FinO family protein [Zoogloeaceae bacterium]|jgi:ProP effector|nr:ProQ/FinO family protein [Zoogloeaceae bacterium]
MNLPPLPAAASSAEPLVAPPPVPDPGPREILKTLYARFPVFRAGGPLAIGIDKAVRAEFPDLPRKALRIALAIHTHSNRYLRNMAKAGQRLDLQGAPAGEITDSQRQYAAERLQERLKKQAETAASALPARQRRLKVTSALAPPVPAAPTPRRKAEPPPQKPESDAAASSTLSLTEKLALLSEKFSRK